MAFYRGDKILKGNPKKHELCESIKYTIQRCERYIPTISDTGPFATTFFFQFEFSSLDSIIWGLWSEILEHIFCQFGNNSDSKIYYFWSEVDTGHNLSDLHTVDPFHASYFIWWIRDILYTVIRTVHCTLKTSSCFGPFLFMSSFDLPSFPTW